jgi:hypothetical protein
MKRFLLLAALACGPALARSHSSHPSSNSPRVKGKENAPQTSFPSQSAWGRASGPSFVVLGDRTGNPLPGGFEQIIGEVRMLRPDLLMNVGNLIDGRQGPQDSIRAQWDSIQALLRSTGADFHLTAGLNDVASAAAESVYFTKFGAHYYSFNTGGCHFVVIDNSRWDSAGALPASELNWLENDLIINHFLRWKFVFMDRSYWLAARKSGRAERLHELFRRYGVQYVFSGGDRYYCRSVWDSIVYTQVGPSGSRDQGYEPEERGGFQNFLYVTVDTGNVNVMVVRPGGLLPADDVTWEDEVELDSIDRTGLRISPVAIQGSRAVSESLMIVVADVTSDFLSGTCTWNTAGTNWHVEPETVAVATAPGGRLAADYYVELPAGANPYPLPVLDLPYLYRPDKYHHILRPLPVTRTAIGPRAPAPRLDGNLNDRCWKRAVPLTGFGGNDGGASPVEPFKVWFAHDDSTLFFAARCTESRMARLRAFAVRRDSGVAEDDNLDFLFQPNPDSAVYYELQVNPDGIIADRKCWLHRSSFIVDPAWNGNWQIAHVRGKNFWTIEGAIPLADFSAFAPPPRSWGLNVARYQARLDRTAVFQAPFGNDPSRFGKLELER